VDKSAIINALRGLNPIGSAEAMVVGENAAGPAEKRDLARAKKGAKGTGWFKDPVADLWGKEIPDDRYQTTNMPALLGTAFKGTPAGGPIQDYLDHPEYFQRVPNAAIGAVLSEPLPDGALGMYTPPVGSNPGKFPGYITLSPNMANPQSGWGGSGMPGDVALHELQHQADVMGGYDDAKRKDALAPMAATDAQRYLLNPTEIRARVTAQRRHFTPTERARFSPVQHMALEANRASTPNADLLYGMGSKDEEMKLLAEALRDTGSNKALMMQKIVGNPASGTGSIEVQQGKVGDFPDQPGKQRHWRSRSGDRTQAELAQKLEGGNALMQVYERDGKGGVVHTGNKVY
jgi:hypothetical protein